MLDVDLIVLLEDCADVFVTEVGPLAKVFTAVLLALPQGNLTGNTYKNTNKFIF